MPENYYSTLQRDSEGYAARVFEELWPRPSVRQAIARLLADFVAQAARSTTAWAVVLDPDAVKLDVGPVQLLTMRSEEVWFCALGSGALRRARRAVNTTATSRASVYLSVPVPSRDVHKNPADVARLPPSLRQAALAYVAEAGARRSGRSSWGYAHSPGVVAFLNSYLGVGLPRSRSGKARGPQTPGPAEEALEGLAREQTVIRRSRNGALRLEALRRARGVCSVCETNFGKNLGELGHRVLQVHHKKQLSLARVPRATSVDELAVVCANCHSMIHCDPTRAMMLDDLRRRIRRQLMVRPSAGNRLLGRDR